MSTSNNPALFRESETNKLMQLMQSSESASIVGVSGVGKSNLFNHLLNPQVQRNYWGEEATNFILVRSNFHYPPDFSDRSIYSLILEQFEISGPNSTPQYFEADLVDQISKQHEALLNSGDDVLRVQRHFKLAIRQLLEHKFQRLVLLFDQFDDVYREASPRLFANLRGLREAYKYRLSYLVFTRDLLTNLAEMDPAREEFYELLAPNILGLKPYNEGDSKILLDRIATRYRINLDDSEISALLHISGGHAGLLRALFLLTNQGQLLSKDLMVKPIESLLSFPSVEMECSKIWDSLSVEEYKALSYCVYGISEVSIEEKGGLLLKGLLDEETGTKLFSPLFAAYVRNQEALWERPIYLDKRKRQVWILSRPTQRLTALEYRLFCALYDRLDELVKRDDLIETGWPEAQGGVSDEALTAAMSRLRKKIEPEPDNPRFLKSIREQGYSLNTS